MTSASALRQQIEASLANRIPSALTPLHRETSPVACTGIESIDRLLHGGLPLGAITEVVGPQCSGRTSLATSFLAQRTRAEKYCAWVDVSNTFDPESSAANGIDLKRVLWIRCGLPDTNQFDNQKASVTSIPPYRNPSKPIKGLHGASFGPHPQTEIKGLAEAIDLLLTPHDASPSLPLDDTSTSGIMTQASTLKSVAKDHAVQSASPSSQGQHKLRSTKPWSAINQALLVTDILLQAGGFDSIVLDLGSIVSEHVSRIPLATWFRYRAAAAKSQSCVILLTRHSTTQSSAELVLNLSSPSMEQEHKTVLSSFTYKVSVTRSRNPSSNVVPLKPPRRESEAAWRSYTPWEWSR